MVLCEDVRPFQSSKTKAVKAAFFLGANAAGAALLKQSQSRLRLNRCLCCLDFHGVDVRHATRSAFKDILNIKVPESRRSGEPHNLSAAWATRRLWRVFTRMFVAHDRKRSLNLGLARAGNLGSRPATTGAFSFYLEEA
jgi:hypothetical protein